MKDYKDIQNPEQYIGKYVAFTIEGNLVTVIASSYTLGDSALGNGLLSICANLGVHDYIIHQF